MKDVIFHFFCASFFSNIVRAIRYEGCVFYLLVDSFNYSCYLYAKICLYDDLLIRSLYSYILFCDSSLSSVRSDLSLPSFHAVMHRIASIVEKLWLFHLRCFCYCLALHFLLDILLANTVSNTVMETKVSQAMNV